MCKQMLVKHSNIKFVYRNKAQRRILRKYFLKIRRKVWAWYCDIITWFYTKENVMFLKSVFIYAITFPKYIHMIVLITTYFNILLCCLKTGARWSYTYTMQWKCRGQEDSFQAFSTPGTRTWVVQLHIFQLLLFLENIQYFSITGEEKMKND